VKGADEEVVGEQNMGVMMVILAVNATSKRPFEEIAGITT